MKLRHVIYYILMFLPGCRYVRWGKDVFYQSKVQCAYTDIQHDYIRSLCVYDQFTTLGRFDVLWLSEAVRTVYSKEYALLYGCSPEDYLTFLQRQLAENEHEIAFYMLAVIPHVQDSLLTECQNPWTIYLHVDGVSYEPKCLEVVKLPYPYQVFFGKRYTLSKQMYYISFDAKMPNGSPVITPATTSLSLCFYTIARKDECVVWDVPSSGLALPCCADNSGILTDPI